MIATYLSNLSRRWPISRQEEMMRAEFPEWPRGVTVFRDELPPSTRRGRRDAELSDRAQMLRPTRRASGGEVVVASLAVLAWNAEDMLACLTLALSRRVTVRVLDAGLTIPPNAGPDVLHAASVAFAAGRKSDMEHARGEMGGRVSGRKRADAAKAAAETIRQEWRLPSDEHPTAELLQRCGLSLNTVKLYLGARPAAQRAYQAELKRKAIRERKKSD